LKKLFYFIAIAQIKYLNYSESFRPEFEADFGRGLPMPFLVFANLAAQIDLFGAIFDCSDF
jgi:hypothetical protein